MIGGLGYKPSPPDTRDYDAAPFLLKAAPAPPERVARSKFTRTLNQGRLGSCTTNAAAQAVRAQMVIQLVTAWTAQGMSFEAALSRAQMEVEFLARLFPYYFARSITHDQGEDTGTFIRFVFQVLNKFGFPYESKYPYSDDTDPKTGKFARMPDSNAIRLAFDQRLKAEAAGVNPVKYSRILSTGYDRVMDVQRAIAANKLVVFGTPVTNKFASDGSANGGKPIDPPTNMKDIAGGHAMVWGGYSPSGVDTLNSWGDGYGDLGWFMMSWDYVAWSETHDLWIVDHAPDWDAKEAA